MTCGIYDWRGKVYKVEKTVALSFQLTLGNSQLMKNLIYFIECGDVYWEGDYFIFNVTSFKDLPYKIMPLKKSDMGR